MAMALPVDFHDYGQQPFSDLQGNGDVFGFWILGKRVIKVSGTDPHQLCMSNSVVSQSTEPGHVRKTLRQMYPGLKDFLYMASESIKE